ncbi:sensor histidine kinase [Nocardioides taihuensis]|uniref:histidine kinase n=1 Tax=Nocardioides taihuensis TaxID=1835606 RepID=A0ABW0BJS6_9ACTN
MSATTTGTAARAAGTTTAAATEPAPPDRDTGARPPRSGVSVRVRIVLTVTVLAFLALAGAGTIVYAIEAERLEQASVKEIDQELDEFAKLQATGTDPETGRPFTSARGVLNSFLVHNVPDDNEFLVTWYGGEAQRSLPAADQFVDSPLFDRTVAPLVERNGTERIVVPEYGDALVTVQSVSDGQETGALVIVTYLELGKAELRNTMQTYAVVSLLALLLIVGVATWQSGRLLAPLRTLRDTAEEIGGTDLARRIPETGNDDITALTRTVNGMLARLEAAFVGQREFLDDAGHELRTPLTVLRGHLELMESSDEREVEQTRALLLDEVDRMSRLVGDLILLTKSARPDFLAQQRVDLQRLTHTLVAKARGMADRDWQVDAVGDAVVTVDEQRITQAVLQLADNAVKHTHPDDRVAIGSRVDGDTVQLWVADTGDGVPEGDREHVFTRFGRSVVRPDDEGFGLGLSIVRAIAEAHGGRVEVTDTPGGGATFTITLPLGTPSTTGPGGPAWPAS